MQMERLQNDLLQYLKSIIILKDNNNKIMYQNKELPVGFQNMYQIDSDIYYNNNDETYWQKHSITVVKDNIQFKEEEFNDVTKIIKENEKLKIKLRIDPLTGIGNVTLVNEKEQDIIYNCKKCTIVSCDINDFKKINDTYGHLIGDMVLKELSNLFKKSIRSNDIVARVGGDEFLFLFETSCVDVIKEKMNNLLTEVQEMGMKIGIPTLSISIGIAYYNGENKYISKKQEADQALYYVKNNGKNNIAYISDDHNGFELYNKYNKENIKQKEI